jgi:hypothetical protein
MSEKFKPATIFQPDRDETSDIPPGHFPSYGTVVDYREAVLLLLHNINDELKRIRQYIEATIR